MSTKITASLRKFTLIVAVAILLTALAACGGSTTTTTPATTTTKPASGATTTAAPSGATTTAAPAGDILVGFSASITGSTPVEGQYSRAGAELAVEEINAKGGVLGRKLKLVVEDDQNDATAAVNAVNKLVSQPIVALIGPHKSFAAKAVMQIITDKKIPYMSGATSVTLLDAKSPYFFRLRASDGLVAKIAAKYCVEDLKATKIGIFFNNDEYGTGAKKVIEEYLTSVKIPFVSEGHNTNDKDMTGQITKMKNAGVDSLIIWTHANENAVAVRQFKELGLKANVVSGPGFTVSNFLDLVDGSMLDGKFTVTDYSPKGTLQINQDFVKNMQDKKKITPDFYAATYYDSVYILADAIKRANSTEREAIRTALTQTKDLQGAMAKYYANSSNELCHESIILKIDGQKAFSLVKNVTE